MNTDNEDLDCLEDFDILGDSLDILEAAEPATAVLEVIVEEIVFTPIIDVLERI